MLIGELAKMAGCEVETIRYYEKEKLLSAPERGTSGYRHYRGEHLGELNFILHCRSLGISLAEIRQLADFRADPSLACEEINQLIDRHIKSVHQQLESLRLLEQQLLTLRQRCLHASDAAHCGIFQTLVQAAEGEGCACHDGVLTTPSSRQD
ncbi:MAG: Cd(II)/Pb(II)-responsive transcriptional regulator [Paludibacterium sp.]|uniref:Cd(II)/Pb(II)-responsive transcriptional regulator n=1 Tax=Paludibacterium sp. TaxID=1917523 RepID=UPI0025E46613|nr:Cd(II)/Pb(II)-responsive transcriptional regulator [Paludibacterium sp.]MBV8045726.1 Cd(II)/Pb(II)-responsive transcriptional regulator [Paludibacterium sp.]MBV8648956.1 Cd(II)/Pb(II)-responsive transcriptional regulator [Paludibacterium sp.]